MKTRQRDSWTNGPKVRLMVRQTDEWTDGESINVSFANENTGNNETCEKQ